MTPPISNDYLIHPSLHLSFMAGSVTVGLAALATQISSPICNIIGSGILIQTGVNVLNHYTMRCRSKKFYKISPDSNQLCINTNNRLLTAIFFAILKSCGNIAFPAIPVLAARTGLQTVGQSYATVFIPLLGTYYGIKNWGKFSAIPRLNAQQTAPIMLAQAILSFSINYLAAMNAKKTTSGSDSDMRFATCVLQNKGVPIVAFVLTCLSTYLIMGRRIQLS